MTGSPLTTPAPTITDPPALLKTANLDVSLPAIDVHSGSILRVGVVHELANGLLEACGSPAVIRPFVKAAGRRLDLTSLTWRWRAYWIPEWTCRVAGMEVTGTVLAPIGERGFAYRLEARPIRRLEAPVVLGFDGDWATTELSIFASRQVAGSIRWWDDQSWTHSLGAELTAPLPLLALGWQADGADRFELERSGGYHVEGQQGLALTLYVAVAPESDGARTAALHLRRRGWEGMLTDTEEWLRARSRAGGDERLTARLNHNLFFNYFYAQADCLDGNRPVMLTSRSSAYYVSAAFWSRDAYLWSFPAILLVDAARARRLLCATLDRHLERAAHHAHYLNGGVLYPGFELDQAAAPMLAIWRYVEDTGDTSILSEPPVRRALETLPEALTSWWEPRIGLYSTFLLPTDDPTTHPYVTFDNALICAALRASALIHARIGLLDRAASLKAAAERLTTRLREVCVARGPLGSMWAFAVDSQGRTEFRDEPPGSLRLLPYYGVCDYRDPAYRNTVAWCASPHNPHFYEGRFPGQGSAHFPYPSGFDLCNRLLTDADPDTLEQLREAPLDQGVGCESFDPETGVVRTGAAMASMGGLIAWTTWARMIGHRIFFEPLAAANAHSEGDGGVAT